MIVRRIQTIALALLLSVQPLASTAPCTEAAGKNDCCCSQAEPRPDRHCCCEPTGGDRGDDRDGDRGGDRGGDCDCRILPDPDWTPPPNGFEPRVDNPVDAIVAAPLEPAFELPRVDAGLVGRDLPDIGIGPPIHLLIQVFLI